MDASSQTDPEQPYTRTERIAGAAGIVFALLLLVVSFDVASGGLLSRRAFTSYAWEQATELTGIGEQP